MDIFYKVLCCVLFTTAVSLRPVDSISQNSEGSLIQNAPDQKCKCENGRCYTDKDGHTKCSCMPGFSLFDEFTCKPCDCGSLGSCIFTVKETGVGQFEQQKQCVCNVGCAPKNGVCVDCFCGINSACDFDFGDRRCYCIEGFSEKNGVCTRCDCGLYGKCKYRNDYKECQCNDGYMEINGICEACNCGPNSEYCRYVNGVKQCKCKPGYVERYGICEVPFKGICKSDDQCVNGVCRNGGCECLPGTSGDRCEKVDCVSGAITCMDQVYLLWKGRDTLFLFWKLHNSLMKFVRENTVVPYVTGCQYGTNVQCNNHPNFLWCDMGHTIYIPTPQNKYLRYRRLDAKGSKCNNNMKP